MLGDDNLEVDTRLGVVNNYIDGARGSDLREEAGEGACRLGRGLRREITDFLCGCSGRLCGQCGELGVLHTHKGYKRVYLGIECYFPHLRTRTRVPLAT